MNEWVWSCLKPLADAMGRVSWWYSLHALFLTWHRGPTCWMSKMLMTSKKQEESEIVVDTGQSPCVQCSSGTNAIFLQILRTKSWYQCYSYLFQFPEDQNRFFQKEVILDISEDRTRPIQREPTGSKGWIDVDTKRGKISCDTPGCITWNLCRRKDQKSGEVDVFIQTFRWCPLCPSFWLEWRDCQNLLGEVCLLFCCLGNRIWLDHRYCEQMMGRCGILEVFCKSAVNLTPDPLAGVWPAEDCAPAQMDLQCGFCKKSRRGHWWTATAWPLAVT